MAEPRIGVVIVTYNSADANSADVPGCKNSLADAARGGDLAATVVVDNAAGDNSAAVAEAARATAVQIDRDAGCAAG